MYTGDILLAKKKTWQLLVRFSHLLWTCWGGKLNDLIFLWKCANASNSFHPPRAFHFCTKIVILKAIEWNCHLALVMYYFIISKRFQSIWNNMCEEKKRALLCLTVGLQVTWHVGQGVQKNSTMYLWISCIKPNRTVFNRYVFPFFACFLRWI